MLSRFLLTKFLHRSSVGSLLSVHCWLGSRKFFFEKSFSATFFFKEEVFLHKLADRTEKYGMERPLFFSPSRMFLFEFSAIDCLGKSPGGGKREREKLGRFGRLSLTFKNCSSKKKAQNYSPLHPS